MSDMRGLTIIVIAADPARFHAALSVAAAHAALDRLTRLFLQGEAAALLRVPIFWAEDKSYSDAGLPTLGELLTEAIALGVGITACQSGLHLAGMTAADLPPGVTTGGIIEILAEQSGNRILMA
jgi:predicted peroxiredoxin